STRWLWVIIAAPGVAVTRRSPSPSASPFSSTGATYLRKAATPRSPSRPCASTTGRRRSGSPGGSSTGTAGALSTNIRLPCPRSTDPRWIGVVGQHHLQNAAGHVESTQRLEGHAADQFTRRCRLLVHDRRGG